MLKLLRFENRWLISEVEEIPGVEFGDPDCVLKYPCEVTKTVSPSHPFPMTVSWRSGLQTSP